MFMQGNVIVIPQVISSSEILNDINSHETNPSNIRFDNNLKNLEITHYVQNLPTLSSVISSSVVAGSESFIKPLLFSQVPRQSMLQTDSINYSNNFKLHNNSEITGHLKSVIVPSSNKLFSTNTNVEHPNVSKQMFCDGKQNSLATDNDDHTQVKIPTTYQNTTTVCINSESFSNSIMHNNEASTDNQFKLNHIETELKTGINVSNTNLTVKSDKNKSFSKMSPSHNLNMNAEEINTLTLEKGDISVAHNNQTITSNSSNIKKPILCANVQLFEDDKCDGNCNLNNSLCEIQIIGKDRGVQEQKLTKSNLIFNPFISDLKSKTVVNKSLKLTQLKQSFLCEDMNLPLNKIQSCNVESHLNLSEKGISNAVSSVTKKNFQEIAPKVFVVSNETDTVMEKIINSHDVVPTANAVNLQHMNKTDLDINTYTSFRNHNQKFSETNSIIPNTIMNSNISNSLLINFNTVSPYSIVITKDKGNLLKFNNLGQSLLCCGTNPKNSLCINNSLNASTNSSNLEISEDLNSKDSNITSLLPYSTVAVAKMADSSLISAINVDAVQSVREVCQNREENFHNVAACQIKDREINKKNETDKDLGNNNQNSHCDETNGDVEFKKGHTKIIRNNSVENQNMNKCKAARNTSQHILPGQSLLRQFKKSKCIKNKLKFQKQFIKEWSEKLKNPSTLTAKTSSVTSILRNEAVVTTDDSKLPQLKQKSQVSEKKIICNFKDIASISKAINPLTDVPVNDVPEEVYTSLSLLKLYFVHNKCLICGFKSKRSKGGDRHMIVHMRVKPHVCDKCFKAFATECRLLQHKLCHEKDENKRDETSLKYKCKECSKSFIKKHLLRQHQYRHKRVIRYNCDICQKGFKTMMCLRRHALIHTGERPYTCEVCGKTFMTSRHHRKHLNSHIRNVPYYCEVCDKNFYSQYYFKVHTRAHKEGNAFQCNICDAKFKFKSNLKQHMITHSEIRRHECYTCGKTFKLPHHLRQHLDTHKMSGSNRTKRKKKLRSNECSNDKIHIIEDNKGLANNENSETDFRNTD